MHCPTTPPSSTTPPRPTQATPLVLECLLGLRWDCPRLAARPLPATEFFVEEEVEEGGARPGDGQQAAVQGGGEAQGA